MTSDNDGYRSPMAVITIVIGVVTALLAVVGIIVQAGGGGGTDETAGSSSSVASPTTVAPPTTSMIAAESTVAAPASSAQTGPYRADWSNGLGGWIGSADWAAVGGRLVNNGETRGTDASITAPYLPTGPDYAVDAEIQLVHNSDAGQISGMGSFGVVVRADSDGAGYGAGRCLAGGIFVCDGPTDSVAVIWDADDAEPIDSVPFEPGGAVHRYRLEVRGNELTVLIDGGTVLRVMDNRYSNAGRVGLWSDRAQITVHSFEITPL